MPRGWKFPIQNENVDYIAPLLPMFSSETPNYITRRGAHFLAIVGRLKPGVDLRTATADLQTIAGATRANNIPIPTPAGPNALSPCNRIWSAMCDRPYSF